MADMRFSMKKAMWSIKGCEMKDDFAAKLISGKAVASVKAAWWPRHCRAISRYLLLSAGGTPNALLSVRDELSMGWVAWEAAIPQGAKKGLMERHTGLEIALMDAARANDEKKIDEIGNLLLENATMQAEACAGAVVGFPKATFLKLLQEHVFLFAKTVRTHKEGKGRSCEVLEQSNTLALAAFTAEWL